MKSFFLLAFLLSQFAFADQEVIQGHWYNDDYVFAMNTDWEDVQGSWGASNYSLAWDSYTHILQGRTAGVYQELEFNEFSKLILGESYCGWITLQYTESTTVHLTGDFCREPINMDFASKAEMLEWIKSNVMLRMVEEFPEPARASIHEFLKKLIQPY